MKTYPPSRITGLILAGGEGRRIGGADKGLQCLDGQTLIARVAQRLRPQVGQLLISANRNQSRYAQFADQVFPDRHWPDDTAPPLTLGPGIQEPGEHHIPKVFEGPLAGWVSAFAHCENDWLLVAPCDSPFLPQDLGQRLWAACQNTGKLAAYATTASGPHPVFSLCHVNQAETLRQLFLHGERKLRRAMDALDAVPVLFEDERAFRNHNTLADLNHSAT